jgi:hypothetical protein
VTSNPRARVHTASVFLRCLNLSFLWLLLGTRVNVLVGFDVGVNSKPTDVLRAEVQIIVGLSLQVRDIGLGQPIFRVGRRISHQG